jgi:hypothetical protein
MLVLLQKPLHLGGEMYRTKDTRQLELENFYLPFGGHLHQNTRWVQLSTLIPWEEFEKRYADQFAPDEMGAPAKPFRMALGALLIKEKLGITDRETVEQIRENPYLQLFIGLESYRDEAPFDASMAGRNPSDCCSPMQPGWSISESALPVKC